MKSLITAALLATLGSGVVTAAQAQSALNANEAKTLQFMHEEEKLARDVYLTLYNKWQIRAFSNIASAEQRHADQLKHMLDKYNVPATVQSDEVGVFANKELASLYKKLTTQGVTSVDEALKVGGLIEEIDIMDLQKGIAESTHAGIDAAYARLMQGSKNHLRAFARQYARYAGDGYTAQSMPEQEVSEILSTAQEKGGKGHGAGGGKGHGRGNG